MVAPVFGSPFFFANRYPASQTPLEHGHCSCGWPSRWRFPHLKKKEQPTPLPLVICDFPLFFPSIICLSMRVFFSCFSIDFGSCRCAGALSTRPPSAEDGWQASSSSIPFCGYLCFSFRYCSPQSSEPALLCIRVLVFYLNVAPDGSM